MMNKMMNSMISQMSVKEREEMMLQMMPEMMKKADVKIMIPNMLATFGKIITLYGLYDVISKMLKDNELAQLLKAKLIVIKESMTSKMPDMMGMMLPLMQNIMPKMMGFMEPMMLSMRMEMKKTGRCIMTDMVEKNDKMKTHMGDMMFDMCPQMAGKVIPKEKGTEFIEKMTTAIIEEK
jgi:predicted house-cleaning noncanonical NTP pyrophosphatase (MazG superfamily)